MCHIDFPNRPETEMKDYYDRIYIYFLYYRTCCCRQHYLWLKCTFSGKKVSRALKKIAILSDLCLKCNLYSSLNNLTTLAFKMSE